MENKQVIELINKELKGKEITLHTEEFEKDDYYSNLNRNVTRRVITNFRFVAGDPIIDTENDLSVGFFSNLNMFADVEKETPKSWKTGQWYWRVQLNGRPILEVLSELLS